MPSSPSQGAAPFGRLRRPLGRTRLARSARRVLTVLGVGTILALVIFHVVLFAEQLGDGRLLDGARLLRWAAGGLLTAGLLWLWRLGVPLLRGRRAVVLWVLIAFLHWGHAGPVAAGHAGAADPAAVTFEVPAVLGALAIGLALITTLLAGRRPPVALARGLGRTTASRGSLAPDALLRLQPPRAPPLFT